jgi:hypothetical protein
MAERNPYPGPRSFEKEDGANFAGRDREARELLSLIVARRVVLLHSPSGAGKTSLIQARLVPDLRRRRSTAVLPLVRVAGQEVPGAANVFVANTLQCLFELSMEEAAGGLTLADGLTRVLEGLPDAAAGRICLIFDQFEELFTGPARLYGHREGFFQQLREALDCQPRLSLLLSMREDYVAALEPYLPFLPDRLSTRLRLDLLDLKAAREAVAEPAKNAHIPFADDARDDLVDNLRQGGPYIEPILLQVVCRRLWERLDPGTREITKDHFVDGGNVDRALEELYQNAVESVARETGVEERALRNWIGANLITGGGIRDQKLAEAGKVAGLDETVVQALVKNRLVRCEPRRGVPFYELVHDRLVSPVRRDNESWSWRNRSNLELLAEEWKTSGEDRALLLSDMTLEAAEKDANDKGIELSERAKSFVKAGESRNRRRRLKLVAVAFLTLCIGAGLIVYSVADWILLRGLDLKARGLEATDPDLALLLALANVQKQFDAEAYADAKGTLIRMLRSRSPGVSGGRLAALSPDDLKKYACGTIGRKPLKEDQWCDYVGPSLYSPVCRGTSFWHALGASVDCVRGEAPNFIQHLRGRVQDRGRSLARRLR